MGKREKFVKAYLETWNPVDSARLAGYSGGPQNWLTVSQSLLKDPDIQRAIKKGEEEPDRYCQACGTKLIRRTNSKGEVEDLGVFKRRKHCNAKCAQHRDRPKGWRLDHSRARKFKKDQCEACGIMESLHAHHIDGDPKNNTAKNIQTLCAWCHRFIHDLMKRLGLDIPGKLPRLYHYAL